MKARRDHRDRTLAHDRIAHLLNAVQLKILLFIAPASAAAAPERQGGGDGCSSTRGNINGALSGGELSRSERNLVSVLSFLDGKGASQLIARTLGLIG